MRKTIVYKPVEGKGKTSSKVLRLVILVLILIVIIAVIVVWNYKGDAKKTSAPVEVTEKNSEVYKQASEAAVKAGILIDKFQWEQARTKLKFAHENGVDTVKYYLAAGRLAVHDRNYLKAAGFLEQAAESGNNKPEHWVLLVCCLEWAGQKNRKVVALSQAIEKTKDSSDDLMWIADQFNQMKMYPEALQVYSVASGKKPVSLRALLSGAECCLKLGKLVRAEKFIQRARQIDSGNPKILELMKQLHQMRKGS